MSDCVSPSIDKILDEILLSVEEYSELCAGWTPSKEGDYKDFKKEIREILSWNSIKSGG